MFPRLSFALPILVAAACSQSQPALNGTPEMLCTQMATKRAACSGVEDACSLSPDGGTSCPDMAGTMPAPDPTKVSLCEAAAPYWSTTYWNAFFACYLDGHTTQCESDYKRCQDTATMAAGQSDAYKTFAAACNATTCDINPDVCFASVQLSDSALEAGTACFTKSCAELEDCLLAAHVE